MNATECRRASRHQTVSGRYRNAAFAGFAAAAIVCGPVAGGRSIARHRDGIAERFKHPGIGGGDSGLKAGILSVRRADSAHQPQSDHTQPAPASRQLVHRRPFGSPIFNLPATALCPPVLPKQGSCCPRKVIPRKTQKKLSFLPANRSLCSHRTCSPRTPPGLPRGPKICFTSIPSYHTTLPFVVEFALT